MIGLIWAQAWSGAIGKEGMIPWHVPEDFAFFKNVTAGRPVIMGRTTWESLHPKFRPLPGRHNVVITRSADYRADGATVVHSLEEAIGAARDGLTQAQEENRIIWIIGGAHVYAEALPIADFASITYLDLDIHGADTFAPTIPPHWRAVAPEHDGVAPTCRNWDIPAWNTSSSGTRYRFALYARPGFEIPEWIRCTVAQSLES